MATYAGLIKLYSQYPDDAGAELLLVTATITAIVCAPAAFHYYFFSTEYKTKGEVYWFFYEDNILTYFCRPGDWETTAPPTIRVQWQDITND